MGQEIRMMTRCMLLAGGPAGSVLQPGRTWRPAGGGVPAAAAIIQLPVGQRGHVQRCLHP